MSTGYESGCCGAGEGDEGEEERRVEGNAREDRYVEAVRNRSLAQAEKKKTYFTCIASIRATHKNRVDETKTERGETHQVNSFPHSVLMAVMSARHCSHSDSQTCRRSSVA